MFKTNVMKIPCRALENESNFFKAAVSKKPKAVLSLCLDVPNFYRTGDVLFHGKIL